MNQEKLYKAVETNTRGLSILLRNIKATNNKTIISIKIQGRSVKSLFLLQAVNR